MEKELMKVLIVDDNADIRQIITRFVKPFCQNVYECEDGIEALESYQRHKPDWVLMDWQMENADGIEATKQIIDQYPDAHICMVSSFGNESLKKEAYKAGASAFVSKDELSDLRTVLND